jgi:hypothetical protein
MAAPFFKNKKGRDRVLEAGGTSEVTIGEEGGNCALPGMRART